LQNSEEEEFSAFVELEEEEEEEGFSAFVELKKKKSFQLL
jgi:hypothetical protein